MRTRALLLLAAFAPAAFAQTEQNEPNRALARSILKELIEINTTDASGDNTRAARAMAARFKTAGYPAGDVQVLEPAPRKGNVVVRLRGRGLAKSVVFIGHLDVVEALRSDWTFDPFQLTEKDGYFYGRGTQDMKGDDALLVTTFMRLKREGFVPDRDLILALTADEESGPHNGVHWLVETHRALIDAAHCFNADAGGGELQNGHHLLYHLQAAEKTYFSVRFTTHNRGGHSSLPRKDNAIYELADVLEKLQAFQFPARLNEITRTYFERMAKLETGEVATRLRAVASDTNDAAEVAALSADPSYTALLRTTCIPTELAGGHAENALPQTASAVINCRLLPDDSSAGVAAQLQTVAADRNASLDVVAPAAPGPASPLRPGVMQVVEAAVGAVWPGTPVVPVMGTGATDSKYLRGAGIPAYGTSAIFIEQNDVRAHGKDERILISSFYDGLAFDYELVKRASRAEAANK